MFYCDYCHKSLEIQKQERIKVQNVLRINSHEWYGRDFQFLISDVNLEPTKFKQFMGFSAVAIDDYLAARIMLKNNELITGAALACTSVEKILKAFMLGVFEINSRKDHWSLEIYKTIKEHEPYFPSLNCWFLQFLQEAYNFRYRESRGKNYFTNGLKVYFSKYQTLAELDSIIIGLMNFFDVVNTALDPEIAKINVASKAHARLAQNQEMINDENIVHLKDNQKKIEYFDGKQDFIIEYFIDSKGNHHEIHYTCRAKKPSDFLSNLQQSASSKEKISFMPTFEPIGIVANFVNSHIFES